MSYAELLKKPQWQKKRLKIMDRDEFTCQMCGDTGETLTVHHISYRQEKGKFVDIWDYDNSELITLCQVCHSQEEATLKLIQKNIFFKLRSCCQNAEALMGIQIFFDMLRDDLGRRVTSKDIGSLCLSFTEKDGE